MSLKYLKTANIKNKTVFLRVDVNEPLDSRGRVADDYRILEIVNTINFLYKNGNKIILAGHLGRPGGRKKEELSLRPVAERLAKLLKFKFFEYQGEWKNSTAKHLVFFTENIQTEKARKLIESFPAGNIVMLENLRFYKGEDENDTFFAKQLASLAEVYINEAFAVSHRSSASVVGITKYLPSYAGLLLEKEIRSLDVVLRNPKSPFVVMMAGIKISDKAKTLENLGKRADKILLGGGLANLFSLAEGFEVGLSVVEKESVKIAWQMKRNFKDRLVLPTDVVVADEKMSKSSIRVCLMHEVKKNEKILDIGPKTILNFAQEIKKAKTLVWNGPMGHFEHKPFHTGTMALAKIVGAVSRGRAFGVVGGGETVDAVRIAGQEKFIDHLSTGGGAMLEYLAGDTLPGIKALEK